MKRKAPTADIEPPSKRQKTTEPNSNANSTATSTASTPQSKKQQSTPRSAEFTMNETEQLLELFTHLQSQNIQNQTLDRCIYDSYEQIYKSFNSDDKDPIDSSFHSKLAQLVKNDVIIPSHLFFEQLLQLKSQIQAMRLLSRDIVLSSPISDLCHGLDNPHSFQRPYTDPKRHLNPSKTKHSKYDLIKKKEENESPNHNILIDSSPQTVEQLIYQNEYDGMKKLVDRRIMLKTYIKNVEQFIKSNGNKTINKHNKYFNIEQYKKAKKEVDTLNLMELQRKMRDKIINSRLDKYIYDIDNAENEALLNPDLFARTAKIGLQFDPHINTANHPPTMATSNNIFPFHYEGEK